MRPAARLSYRTMPLIKAHVYQRAREADIDVFLIVRWHGVQMGRCACGSFIDEPLSGPVLIDLLRARVDSGFLQNPFYSVYSAYRYRGTPRSEPCRATTSSDRRTIPSNPRRSSLQPTRKTLANEQAFIGSYQRSSKRECVCVSR
jgi:hypothetical protein